MHNWTIGPALPLEAEVAEDAYSAYLRDNYGPLWGEANEAEAERLRVALVAAYDKHGVPQDERRVDV